MLLKKLRGVIAIKFNRWVLILSVAFTLALAVILFLLQYRISLVCMMFPVASVICLCREQEKKGNEHKLNIIILIFSMFIFIASIVFNVAILH